MKTLLFATTILTLVSVNVAIAKQDTSANPRVVSQEDGLTAGATSNKPEDINITKKIRRELMKDSALSMKAKNVNIIVANKGVTLKGSVESDVERAQILKHAYISAPKYKIYNQISIVK